MSGAATFTFKSSKMSSYRVTVDAKAVSIFHEIEGRPEYSKTRRVAFDEVHEAALHELKLRNGVSEGMFLQTHAGKSIGFSANSSGASGAREEDIRACRSAAAAVMRALAEAQPEVKVRKGQTRQSKVAATIVLTVIACVLAGIFVLLSGGGSLVSVALIFIMMALHAIFRVGVLKKPVFIPAREAVSYLTGKSVWAK